MRRVVYPSASNHHQEADTCVGYRTEHYGMGYGSGFGQSPVHKEGDPDNPAVSDSVFYSDAHLSEAQSQPKPLSKQHQYLEAKLNDDTLGGGGAGDGGAHCGGIDNENVNMREDTETGNISAHERNESKSTGPQLYCPKFPSPTSHLNEEHHAQSKHQSQTPFYKAYPNSSSTTRGSTPSVPNHTQTRWTTEHFQSPSPSLEMRYTYDQHLQEEKQWHTYSSVATETPMDYSMYASSFSKPEDFAMGHVSETEGLDKYPHPRQSTASNYPLSPHAFFYPPAGSSPDSSTIPDTWDGSSSTVSAADMSSWFDSVYVESQLHPFNSMSPISLQPQWPPDITAQTQTPDLGFHATHSGDPMPTQPVQVDTNNPQAHAGVATTRSSSFPYSSFSELSGALVESVIVTDAQKENEISGLDPGVGWGMTASLALASAVEGLNNSPAAASTSNSMEANASFAYPTTTTSSASPYISSITSTTSAQMSSSNSTPRPRFQPDASATSQSQSQSISMPNSKSAKWIQVPLTNFLLPPAFDSASGHGFDASDFDETGCEDGDKQGGVDGGNDREGNTMRRDFERKEEGVCGVGSSVNRSSDGAGRGGGGRGLPSSPVTAIPPGSSVAPESAWLSVPTITPPIVATQAPAAMNSTPAIVSAPPPYLYHHHNRYLLSSPSKLPHPNPLMQILGYGQNHSPISAAPVGMSSTAMAPPGSAFSRAPLPFVPTSCPRSPVSSLESTPALMNTAFLNSDARESSTKPCVRSPQNPPPSTSSSTNSSPDLNAPPGGILFGQDEAGPRPTETKPTPIAQRERVNTRAMAIDKSSLASGSTDVECLGEVEPERLSAFISSNPSKQSDHARPQSHSQILAPPAPYLPGSEYYIPPCSKLKPPRHSLRNSSLSFPHHEHRHDEGVGISGERMIGVSGMGVGEETAGGRDMQVSTVSKAKPKIACWFCRGRKIGCQLALPGTGNMTCKSCLHRGLKCDYPKKSRRGLRDHKSPKETPASGNVSMASTSMMGISMTGRSVVKAEERDADRVRVKEEIE